MEVPLQVSACRAKTMRTHLWSHDDGEWGWGGPVGKTQQLAIVPASVPFGESGSSLRAGCGLCVVLGVAYASCGVSLLKKDLIIGGSALPTIHWKRNRSEQHHLLVSSATLPLKRMSHF